MKCGQAGRIDNAQMLEINVGNNKQVWKQLELATRGKRGQQEWPLTLVVRASYRVRDVTVTTVGPRVLSSLPELRGQSSGASRCLA